jgi:hypothetical protein
MLPQALHTAVLTCVIATMTKLRHALHMILRHRSVIHFAPADVAASLPGDMLAAAAAAIVAGGAGDPSSVHIAAVCEL